MLNAPPIARMVWGSWQQMMINNGKCMPMNEWKAIERVQARISAETVGELVFERCPW